MHQQAYMHILSANDWCPPQPLYLEQAQLYWQKGCQEDAFTTLNRCFSNCFQPAQYYKQLPSGDCNEERRHFAKVSNIKKFRLSEHSYFISTLLLGKASFCKIQ